MERSPKAHASYGMGAGSRGRRGPGSASIRSNVVAAFSQQVYDAVRAHEVQGADDDEQVLAGREAMFELGGPGAVAGGDEGFVEGREVLEVRQELAGQGVAAAVAPGRDQWADFGARRIELLERLRQQRALARGVERGEDVDLSLQRLEAENRLAVAFGFGEQVLLHAALRVEALGLHALIQQRERREPGLVAVEGPQREAERVRPPLGLRIELRAELVLEGGAGWKSRGRLELGLGRGGVEVVEVELEQQRVGARVEPIDDGRQRIVRRAQVVHGAEQPELAAALGHVPGRGFGARGGGAEDAGEPRGRQRGGPKCARHALRFASHSTSVSMRPSGCSSSQRRPGGRPSIANDSLPGLNCEHVEGVLR